MSESKIKVAVIRGFQGFRALAIGSRRVTGVNAGPWTDEIVFEVDRSEILKAIGERTHDESDND